MDKVKHGKAANKMIPEKQVPADLIALMKKVILKLSCEFDYRHGYGHLNEIL